MEGDSRSFCKEEVYLHFPVLAAELWEQRGNTHVLLTWTFRSLKKEEETLEWQDGVDPCAKKRFSRILLSWLLSCGRRGRRLMFGSLALLGWKRRKKKQESGRMV